MSSFLPISLQVRQIISKLCEDSETLPPGYLIDQLTKMTFDRFNSLSLLLCVPDSFFAAMRVPRLRSSFARNWRRTPRISGSRLCASLSLCAKTARPTSSEIYSVRHREFAAACNGKARPIPLWETQSTRWSVMPLRSVLTRCSTRSLRPLVPKFPHKVQCLHHVAVFLCDARSSSFSGFGSNSSGADSYIAPSGGAAPISAGYSGGTSAPGSGKYAGFGNPEFQGKERTGSVDLSSLQDAGAKAMSFMADGLSKLKGKIDETTKQNASPTVGSSSLYQNPGNQVNTIADTAHRSSCSFTHSCSPRLAPSPLAVAVRRRTTSAVPTEAATATPLLQRRLVQLRALMALPSCRPAAA